jgi:hypothetical protein
MNLILFSFLCICSFSLYFKIEVNTERIILDYKDVCLTCILTTMIYVFFNNFGSLIDCRDVRCRESNVLFNFLLIICRLFVIEYILSNLMFISIILN